MAKILIIITILLSLNELSACECENHETEEISNLEYEIEFEHITTTPATSSAFLTSYADVTFGNLRTFSGDVNKVKLFGRQKDKQNAEFEKFGEFILETKNELKDSTSITGDDPVGIFYSQSVVDNFWQSSSAAQPIEIDNTQIMNAVLSMLIC